jgi:4-alpha-glucanotransferase
MDRWGVEDGYWDVAGAWHVTPPEGRAVLRAAMGAAGGDDEGPPAGRPVWFVRSGSAPALLGPAHLVLEDGTEVGAPVALPPDLPLGYHDLVPLDGGPSTRLIVVPDRMAPAPERLLAVSTQLYATRSRSSWGIGDLGDLATLARWVAAREVGALLVSPLHAPLPVGETEPSPYFASSRCWRNPLHLRIEHVPGFDPGDLTLTLLAERGRGLDAERRIDRRAVWDLKRAALERIWRTARPAGRELARWRAEQGEALTTYAVFCALAEHHGRGWRSWPAEHHHPQAAGVARFAAANPDAVGFHAWLQWCADRQHRASAGVEGVGLIHDLAVGASPDGADAWVWQDLLATGVRVGAPPDEFNADGQDWGIPPFVPWRLRDAGYEPLAHLFRSSFRHAAGLRVDHVMGLFRLFWVPDGSRPAEGGYVRYPDHELLDVLALESARAGSFVVGEDLGTVEDEVRAALGARGALSYRVAWFEGRPPEEWPHPALAAVTTHDLPTVAGVWSGTDPQAGGFRDRLARLVGEPWPTTATEASERVHRRLGRAPSAVVSATMEDLLGVPDRHNVPGTTTEHPNWSVALPTPLDDLDSTGADRILAALAGDPPA